MKNKNKIVLKLLLFLVLPFLVNAQDSLPVFSYSIKASKNNQTYLYKPGARLLIKYAGESKEKVRGIFTGVIGNKIVITRKRKKEQETLIPVESIAVVRKIRPGKRILYAAVGTTLIGGSAVMLDRVGNGPAPGMAVALFIPVIGAGVYTLCAIPVSLLIEKLGEKKQSNGWSFELQGYR